MFMLFYTYLMCLFYNVFIYLCSYIEDGVFFPLVMHWINLEAVNHHKFGADKTVVQKEAGKTMVLFPTSCCTQLTGNLILFIELKTLFLQQSCSE